MTNQHPVSQPQSPNVLCAVDLSSLSTRELDAAAEIAAVLGARLVVVHNCADLPSESATSVGWRRIPFDDGSPHHDAARRLSTALQRIAGRVPLEAVLTTGALPAVFDRLAESLRAELVLLGNHGPSTRGRGSLTEYSIARGGIAVLVVHDDDLTGTQLRIRRGADESLPRILVPVDFGAATPVALEWVRRLARAAPLDVHLLHVLPTAATLARAAISGRLPADLVEEARARLRASVPADFPGCVSCDVELGDARTVIASYADRIGPDLVIMGQHTRAPLVGVASRDTARRLLHRAWCPVLFVPSK